MYFAFSLFNHDINTYKYMRKVLKRFCDFRPEGDRLRGELIADMMVPHDVTLFLQSARTKHEWNFLRKEVHACFQWYIHKFERNTANPAKACKRSGHTAKARVPLNDEMICMILEESEARPLDHDMLVFYLCTLARPDEALRTKWVDWNREEGTIRLWTRKRKGGRWEFETVPIPLPLHEVLERRWNERTQEEWIFVNPRTGKRFMHRPKMMAGICHRAMIPPIGYTMRKNRKGVMVKKPKYWGLHDLRHFMTAVLKGKLKVDTAKISRHLRHKSIRTTEIYLQTLQVDITDSGQQIGSVSFISHVAPPVLIPSESEEGETPEV